MARPPKLSKNAVIIVLLLLDIYIFRLNFQRTESLAAVPVPLAEELEELQSQRVHEAADQVQRKVQVIPLALPSEPSWLNTLAITLPASISAIRRE